MTFSKYGRGILNRKSLISVIQSCKMSTEAQDPVLLETVGTAGLVTLNRPKQLNAFSYNMWKILLPCLQEWQQTKSRLIIKGTGRAFSAGGDIKWLHLTKQDTSLNFAYKHAFANAMYLLSKYNIPYIALMDGIAIGSGLMLAAHGRYRIATERTKITMPEARIGSVADASATYVLSRLSQHFGFYMVLTGQQFEGKDVVSAGLATHFVPSDRLQELEAKLCWCKIENIEALLNTFSEPPEIFSLDAVKGDIDYCFSAGTVEEIVERLSKLNNSWSSRALKLLNQMCPTMLKVCLRALQKGKTSDIKECIRVENRVLSRCQGNYNSKEGVRAALLDKSSPPKWQPSSLAEVTDSMVDRYFDPLPIEEEMTFLDD